MKDYHETRDIFSAHRQAEEPDENLECGQNFASWPEMLTSEILECH